MSNKAACGRELCGAALDVRCPCPRFDDRREPRTDLAMSSCSGPNGEPSFKLAARRRLGLLDARPLPGTVSQFIFRLEGLARVGRP